MWRSNVRWGSIDTSPPEGMFKHETGAYFKTPSQPAAELERDDEQTPDEAVEQKRLDGRDHDHDREYDETNERRPELGAKSIRQQQVRENANKEQQRRLSGIRFVPKQQETQPANFRSRLSSISGALQHPRRLLGASQSRTGRQSRPASALAEAAPATNSAVQITTTSESPEPRSERHQSQEGSDEGRASPNQFDYEQQQRFLSSSSGRRLSQLFLPQVPPSAANLLAAGQDPYAAAVVGELIPSHLLGLYGQTQTSPGGHRASWADASLFARLNQARASIDSAAASAHRRHSLDSRKYQPKSMFPPTNSPNSPHRVSSGARR